MGPAGTFGLLSSHRCFKVPFKLQSSGGGVGTDRGKVDGDNGVTGGISPSQGLFGHSETRPSRAGFSERWKSRVPATRKGRSALGPLAQPFTSLLAAPSKEGKCGRSTQ